MYIKICATFASLLYFYFHAFINAKKNKMLLLINVLYIKVGLKKTHTARFKFLLK